jgi:YD repeat-containing protein
MKFFIPFCAAFIAVTIMCTPAHAGSIAYTYDNAGRLSKADYGSDRSIGYTYDTNGNLLQRTVQGTTTTYTLTVSVSPVTGGSVTGNGIDCPGDCAQDYDENTNVGLTAHAADQMTFLRWEGALTGTTNPDSLLMNTDKQVTAYFGAASGNTDTDGVPDGTESGPGGDDPGYDGDGNGIPDYQEAGAASLPSASGGAYATLAVPTGSGLALHNVQAQANPSPGEAPADVQFPYGFFRFRATGLNAGACTTVTLYLPRDETIDTYYKYGPTTDNPTDHWYEFLFNGRTGAQIFHEGGQTRIVLYLCDGERGDSDLTVNGRIDEPGGPGVMGGAPPIPTLSEWGMILFIGLMLLAGIRFLRRSGSPTSAAA